MFYKKVRLDLFLLFLPILSLLALSKIQKNLHYLLFKTLPENLLPTYLSLNLFDLFFLGALFYWRSKLRLPNKTTIFLCLFLIWTRLSLFNIHADYLSHAHVLFFTLFASTSAFFLSFWSKLREKWEQHFHFLLICLVTYSSFQCVIALSQFILQKPLGLSFISECHMDSYLGTSIPFSSLYLGKIFRSACNATTILRSYGTLSHPNLLAGLLSSAIFSFYFLYHSYSKQKTFISLLIGIHIFTLFTTFSRSGILSSLLLSALFFARKQDFKLISIVVCSWTIGLVLLSPIALQRTINFPILGKISGVEQARLTGYHIAKEMILKHPVSGVGYKQFVHKINSVLPKNSGPVERLPAHNIYLLIAAETGLVGLFFFLGFLLLWLLEALNNFFASPHTHISYFCFCYALILLTVGLVDCYPITSFYWRITLFSLLGLTIATRQSQREPV